MSVEHDEFVEGISVHNQASASARYVQPVAWKVEDVVSRKGQVDVHLYIYVWDDARRVLAP